MQKWTPPFSKKLGNSVEKIQIADRPSREKIAIFLQFKYNFT